MGAKPIYVEMARQVARLFHQKGWTLVYGASSERLMGVVALELNRLGGKVRGVKPRCFLKYEPAEQVPDVGENEIVADLHSQKVRMTQLSDAFLFLPGGFGTFEELGTYRMWGKLGVHVSPIIVFNFEGYYDRLLEWFNVAIEEGFATPLNAGVFSVISRLEDLEEAFARYRFVPSVLHDFGDLAPAGVVKWAS